MKELEERRGGGSDGERQERSAGGVRQEEWRERQREAGRDGGIF